LLGPEPESAYPKILLLLRYGLSDVFSKLEELQRVSLVKGLKLLKGTDNITRRKCDVRACLKV
jgi:hypothetical protein